LVFCAACSKGPAGPAVERIAFLRFENLGADQASDWVGRALPEAIAGQLEGLPEVYPIAARRLHGLDATLGPRPVAAPGISTERAEALAAGANRIAYGEYMVRGGRLEARLSLEDPETRKTVRVISASAGGGDVLAAAAALAQGISGRLASYATRNPAALKAFILALEDADPVAAGQNLEQSLAADPDFGPAYEQLAQVKLRQEDPATARDALERGLARGAGIGPVERARLELDLAVLRGDEEARERALASLTRAEPADPSRWRDLGVAQMARHRFAPAAAAFRNSLRIEPDDPDTLNQLGYAATYDGHDEEAVRALTRYRKLQPANPNPADSLGDIHLIAGRLREAERYYLEAAKINPDFLSGSEFYKASMARLMTGDVTGADALAQQYAGERTAAHDPLADFRRAQWSWISGRRQAACQQMEKLAREAESSAARQAESPAREVAARAYAEVSIWNALLGQREAAEAMSQKAVALATPSSAGAALLARFLAQPPASPAEWTARAGRLLPDAAQASLRNLALACALLLAKQYQAAAPLLQQLYDGGQIGDESIPVLLAWADLETGRVNDAASLLRFQPVPSTTSMGPFTPFYFPRLFYLRGALAERQGKAAEARENYALFEKLAGDERLVWDSGRK